MGATSAFRFGLLLGSSTLADTLGEWIDESSAGPARGPVLVRGAPADRVGWATAGDPDPVTLRTATGTPAAEAQIVSLVARTLTEFDQEK